MAVSAAAEGGKDNNIAYLLRFWPVYGGGETVARLLLNELARRGHHVFVYYLWDRTGGMDVELDERITARRIENVSGPEGIEGIAKRDYPRIEEALSAFFAEDKINIIIDQWIPTKIAHRARQRTGAKLIKCHHAAVKYVPSIRTLKQKLFYGIFKRSGGWLRVFFQNLDDLRYSDRWIFLCGSYAQDAIKLYHLRDTHKIGYVPNPINGRPIDSAVMEKKENIVLFVGRVVPTKGLHLLLTIWGKLKCKGQTNGWKFIVVGDGPELEYCVQHAKRIGCDDVLFMGYRDPMEFYLRSSIFVMASRFEGWPMVLGEAQINGCVPVVFDSLSAFREIITDGENGILVENNDLDGYAEKLSMLMHDKDMRSALARNAVVSCERFSLTKIVDQWERLFESLE